jgi:pimeloyl-ACP methyl ester carboxylesterase
MKITGIQISILIGIFFCALFSYRSYDHWVLEKESEKTANAKRDSYQLISKQCWFTVDWQKTAKCFHLKTPVSSGEFYLPVVIIKDESTDHRDDPVVYLQGGPGLGASLDQEGINEWMNWLTLANLKRDLILLDPRGSGFSLPKFNCSDKGEQSRLWKQNLALTDELSLNNESMMKCLASLEAQHSALVPQHFGTENSAKDVISLIRLLNYQRWNILGVSYGTRLALEIDRQLLSDPSSNLNAMVLDSIYPAGFGGVQTWPQVLDSAISGFFEGCVHQPECKQHLKNTDQLKENFFNALVYLKNNPVKLTISRWDGEAPVLFVVNDHRFVSATFAAIYDPRDWPDIVLAINSINLHQGIILEDNLKKLIEPYLNRNLNSQFNSLAFTAVDCADNTSGSKENYLESLVSYPLMADYTKDQWQYQLCHQLPTNRHLKFENPKAPTLILAGKNDPVTPASWASEVNQKWKNSQLIMRNDLAHSVLSTDICLLENVNRFFDEPTKTFGYCN